MSPWFFNGFLAIRVRGPKDICWKCITRDVQSYGRACESPPSSTCSNYTVISCLPHWKRVTDMEICRHRDHIELFELDPFLAELLRQIPASASPDGALAAERRLFSAPAHRRETEFCGEWKTYVEPELRRLFQSATETVTTDLQQ